MTPPIVQMLVILKCLELVRCWRFRMFWLWWLEWFDFFKLALLQIIEQDLLLIGFSHRSELSQFVHLEDAERLLIIQLLLLHGLQLLYVL